MSCLKIETGALVGAGGEGGLVWYIFMRGWLGNNALGGGSCQNNRTFFRQSKNLIKRTRDLRVSLPKEPRSFIIEAVGMTAFLNINRF